MIVILFLIPTAVIILILTAMGFYVLRDFPRLAKDDIVFREKRVSGYNNYSFITRYGGANKILDVVVTGEELWIKAPVIFAGIMPFFGLIHKVPLEAIHVDRHKDDALLITIREPGSEVTEMVLLLKRKEEFILAIKKAKDQ